MRQDKAERLLRLAMQMHSYSGCTLREIEEQFGVSHRTAQHYRDAVGRLFPQMEETTTDTKELAWKIPTGTLTKMVEVSAEEISALEEAVEQFNKLGLLSQANDLALVKDKILSCMHSSVRSRIESDTEYLSNSRLIATKPGPIASLPDEDYLIVRDSILSGVEIEFTYHKEKRRNGKMVGKSKRRVQPYGIMTGHRHYLLGVEGGQEQVELKKFAFPRISGVKKTTNYFEKDAAISIGDYSIQSFGIYMEEEAPFDVEWKFSRDAAPTAKEFKFHPSQQFIENEDGSLTVKFRAGGLQEMAWHLCLWGNKVEILAPKQLQKMLDPSILQWNALP